MTVFVFGNPDLPGDALPLMILPRLRERFPGSTFETKDPNEEWEVPEHLTVIDTVQGIDRVTAFPSLELFDRTPNLTVHDFDALSQLRLLQKLGKLKSVRVIGVPPDAKPDAVLPTVVELLSS